MMIIRRLPEDFGVEEVLRSGVVQAVGARACGWGVYRVEKRSLTTREAASRLGAAIGRRANEVQHAGLKDKHAVTVQHMSVGLKGPALPGRVEGSGWRAELAGWSKEEAGAAWIRRNRFRLVVRGMTAEACARMDGAAERLTCGAGRLLVVNYFGDQRFGSARHGEGFAAARLVRGDFEGALRLLIGTPARKDSGARREFTRQMAEGWGRWGELVGRLPRMPERRAVEVLARGGGFVAAFGALPSSLQQMCVEAYQSHMWNGVAARLASRLAGRGEEGMVFVEPSRANAGWRAVEAPMLAATTRLADPWREAAEEVLRREGLTVAGLVIPGVRRPAFREAWRPLFVQAEGVVISTPEVDEVCGRMKRVVSFELPRGAYATVVLRGLER